MKKISLVVLSLLAANTVFAQTSSLSYDYVEANLGTGDVFDEDFSFFGVGGSYSINENLFLTGSYSDGSTDDYIDFGFGASKVELSGYNIGLGFHTPVNQQIDFVAGISYLSSELEIFGLSEDGDGYGIDAGFRFKPTDRVELNIFANYVDVESEGDSGYSAAAYYFLTPTFSVGLNYSDDGDTDTVAGSFRLHF
jgi:hypothetical protein